MRAMIRYVLATNKVNILKKSIIQLVFIFTGIILNIAFVKVGIDVYVIYNFFNVIFYLGILLMAFDIYVVTIENIRYNQFDVYIRTTPIGINQMYNSILLFDILFGLYSYVLGNMYIFIIRGMDGVVIEKSIYGDLLNIYIWFYVVKFVNIILLTLLYDMKVSVILSVILVGLVGKFFDELNDIKIFSYDGYVSWSVLLSLFTMCIITCNVKKS